MRRLVGHFLQGPGRSWRRTRQDLGHCVVRKPLLRLTGRHWTTAFAAALAAHAFGLVLATWQPPDPETGVSGPGVISVSLGQMGGIPVSAAMNNSEVPGAELVTAAEPAPDAAVAAAVSAKVPAAAIPAPEPAPAEELVTPLFAETVDPARAAEVGPSDAKAALPDQVESIAVFEQPEVLETLETDAIAVADTPFEASVTDANLLDAPAAETPVEQWVAAELSPAPDVDDTVIAEATLVSALPDDVLPVAPHSQTDAVETSVMVPVEARSVELLAETIVTGAELADTPEIQEAVSVRTAVPAAAEVRTVPVVSSPAVVEVDATSPPEVVTTRLPVDPIDATIVPPDVNPVDINPPDPAVDVVEEVDPAPRRQPQRPGPETVFESNVDVEDQDAGATQPSRENDPDQSATLATVGAGARIETGGSSAVHDSYQQEVLEQIARFKRYPRAARRDGVAGTVVVRFVILSNGSLTSHQLTGSSGDSRLDQAALEMLEKASPFPPIPRSLGTARLELSLPVEFTLSEKRTLF